MDVGLIGLGRMGSAMLGRLLARGQPVVAFDRSPAARDAAAAQGARVVDRPSACGAPRLLLSLPDESAVAEVLDDILPALPAGAVVIDTSTLGAAAARRFAALAAGKGVAYLDAPVSGGPAGASAGTLSVMLGGPAEAVERARPVLEHLAARQLHVGGPGAGQVAKLANNLLVATHLMAAAEALRMAQAAGVAPETLLPVLNASSGRSAATEVNWPRWIASGRFDSGFSAGLMRKDARLARDLAREAAVPLPVCGAAVAAWEASPVGDAEEFNRVPAALLEQPRHG